MYVLAWTNEENVKAHRERDKEILPYDEQWRSCDYWLENIRLHGKDSPIIMVQTHTDKFANKLEAEEAWSKYYDALNLDFSAAKDYGLPQLKDIIADRLNAAVPMLGKEFPKTYENVIQEIERIKEEEPMISRERFLSICKQSKIDKGGEDSLLDYLRKAGLVVYFDKKLLREIVYINPNWLTRQVYRLINNDLGEKQGKIDTTYLEKILPAPEYDDTKRTQFVKLLQNFELIFQPEEENYYVAPQYLPKDLAAQEQRLFNMLFSSLKLAFVFRFPKYIPDNVMINFLSRYGPFAEKLYWKNGICFTSEQKVNAVVKYHEERQCLHVFTPDTEAAKLLQNEICKAFVELSRNANAEISLDGKIFASWQKLNKHAELYAQNPEQQFFAEDGKTSLYVKDFEHFLPLGEHGMGRFKVDVGIEMQEIKNLVVSNKIADALGELEIKTPKRLENNLMLLRQRFNNLRDSEIADATDPSILKRERTQLSWAILKFCDDVRKQNKSTD